MADESESFIQKHLHGLMIEPALCGSGLSASLSPVPYKIALRAWLYKREYKGSYTGPVPQSYCW